MFILCPEQLLCLVHPVREMTSKEDDSQRLCQGSCFRWVTIAAAATSCPCEVSCVHSLFCMCVPHLGLLQHTTHHHKRGGFTTRQLCLEWVIIYVCTHDKSSTVCFLDNPSIIAFYILVIYFSDERRFPTFLNKRICNKKQKALKIIACMVVGQYRRIK